MQHVYNLMLPKVKALNLINHYSMKSFNYTINILRLLLRTLNH